MTNKGTTWNGRWVTPGKIVRTFERAEVGEKVVRDSIARQTERVQAAMQKQLERANAFHPSPVYAEIARGIRQRIRQLD